MISTGNPVSSLPPQEYRNALDGAMASLATAARPLVLCETPELVAEVYERAALASAALPPDGALWVEPPAETWRSDLAALSDALPSGAPLVVVASRPLARLLPETRAWAKHSLGLRPFGLAQLRRELASSGFVLEANHGFHSPVAIALNALGQRLERLGRPDLGDRLHFAARLRYHVTGPLAVLSTAALLVARKKEC